MGSEKEDSGVITPELYKEDGAANVAVTMGYGFAFGKGKCSVTISLKCDQDEKTINHAAYLATCRADELAREGMEIAKEYLTSQGMWE